MTISSVSLSDLPQDILTRPSFISSDVPTFFAMRGASKKLHAVYEPEMIGKVLAGTLADTNQWVRRGVPEIFWYFKRIYKNLEGDFAHKVTAVFLSYLKEEMVMTMVSFHEVGYSKEDQVVWHQQMIKALAASSRQNTRFLLDDLNCGNERGKASVGYIGEHLTTIADLEVYCSLMSIKEIQELGKWSNLRKLKFVVEQPEQDPGNLNFTKLEELRLVIKTTWPPPSLIFNTTWVNKLTTLKMLSLLGGCLDSASDFSNLTNLTRLELNSILAGFDLSSALSKLKNLVRLDLFEGIVYKSEAEDLQKAYSNITITWS